jgi:CheY-like chemotaxis protein
MSTPVVICDDAGFARKQLARALPTGWDVDVTFAANGAEAITALRRGKGDILFLDLNMPGMDGYQVLQAIRDQDLPTMVIVVSGDVQPEAHRRVMKLGAMAFLRKPVAAWQIAEVLDQYGIHHRQGSGPPRVEAELQVSVADGYQEIANVAMGRAADSLARLLNAFVVLPTPKVRTVTLAELKHLVGGLVSGEEVIPVICQGFIGAGVAGEALVAFREASAQDIAALVRYEGDIDEGVERELLMDLANVLVSACLKGIGDQLDVGFSQGYPLMIGRHVELDDLLKGAADRWTQTLGIEMGYRIEHRRIGAEMLILFTEDSLDLLGQRVAFLIE